MRYHGIKSFRARHKVIPRKFDLEEFGNYVFVGIRWVWRFLRMDFAV